VAVGTRRVLAMSSTEGPGDLPRRFSTWYPTTTATATANLLQHTHGTHRLSDGALLLLLTRDGRRTKVPGSRRCRSGTDGTATTTRTLPQRFHQPRLGPPWFGEWTTCGFLQWSTRPMLGCCPHLVSSCSSVRWCVKTATASRDRQHLTCCAPGPLLQQGRGCSHEWWQQRRQFRSSWPSGGPLKRNDIVPQHGCQLVDTQHIMSVAVNLFDTADVQRQVTTVCILARVLYINTSPVSVPTQRCEGVTKSNVIDTTRAPVCGKCSMWNRG